MEFLAGDGLLFRRFLEGAAGDRVASEELGDPLICPIEVNGGASPGSINRVPELPMVSESEGRRANGGDGGGGGEGLLEEEWSLML